MCRSGSCAHRDFVKGLGEANNPEWKTVAYDETSGEIVVPQGLGRLPLGREGQMEPGGEGVGQDQETRLRLSLATSRTARSPVGFPYFGNREHDHFAGTDHPDVLMRNVPARTLQLADGETLVASVFDLFVANYGVDRGFGGENLAKSYDDREPYTPAWAEKITGVPRDQIITVAREFALNAEKTKRPLDGDRRRRPEPLVPHGHELPRHHQHAGDVRMRRPVRRRLVALCRPGKAAAAVRLDAARVRPRLEPSAAADELDLGFLRPYRPVALRDARRSARSCRRPRRRARGTAH